MDDKSGIEIVKSYLDVLPKSLSDKIIDKLKHTINYEPVIVSNSIGLKTLIWSNSAAKATSSPNAHGYLKIDVRQSR